MYGMHVLPARSASYTLAATGAAAERQTATKVARRGTFMHVCFHKCKDAQVLT